MVDGHYLVAEIATTCNGDVAMKTDHPGGEGDSRWGSLGAASGERASRLLRGLLKSLCAPLSGGVWWRPRVLPILCSHA